MANGNQPRLKGWLVPCQMIHVWPAAAGITARHIAACRQLAAAAQITPSLPQLCLWCLLCALPAQSLGTLSIPQHVN